MIATNYHCFLSRIVHWKPGGWLRVFCAVMLLVGGASAWGQAPLVRSLPTASSAATDNANDQSPALDTASAEKALEEKLAKVRADLAAIAALEPLRGTTNLTVAAARDLALRRGYLERLVRIYEQQIAYVADIEAARSRRANLAHEVQAWTGFTERHPHSIIFIDALREAIQMENFEIANGEKSLVTLDKLVEENRALLKQADEKIRQLNEQFERTPAGGENDERIWSRELEKLRSQNASAMVAMLDLERQLLQERLAGSRIRLGLLKQQLVIANAGATFSDGDMEQILARLDSEQHRLDQELQEALLRQQAAERASDEAQTALQEVQARTGAGQEAIARAVEQFELRREQSETARNDVKLLRLMLQSGATERAIWELRFSTYRSAKLDTIRQVRVGLDQFGRRLQLWLDYYRQEMETSATQIGRLEARLADLAPASELAPLLRERLATLRQRDQMYLRVVRKIERDQRLLDRLREEMQESTGNLPFMSRLGDAFSDAQNLLGRLWSFELFVAQDTITVDGQKITGKRSVTLGKIITAILILVVGYWLAGLVSRVLEPIFIKHFKIEANQATLIRRWVRVVLVVGLALFSLALVRIPLTVFAFAGGALAIGLGFGLQTMLKNFVCGIIILFERPFRVGDVLDVGGQRGTVVNIGIRSSVLQLWDGTETLIPNSTLLENNLTNWTYSNRIVRFTIIVGVAYGSEARRVMRLLEEIADRHDLVVKEPKPQVLFTNFGASSLDFELRFWLDVVKANSAQVASDLRLMIADAFAENGLVLAFPQHDVHFDATQPIPVRLVSAVEEKPSASPTPPVQNSKKETP